MFELKKIKMTLAASVLALFLNCAVAQDSAVGLGTTQLNDAVKDLTNKKDFVGARPYIEQLIIRITDSDDKKLKAQLPELYFFKAFSYIQEYKSKESAGDAGKYLKMAIADFDKVLESPNSSSFVEAIKMKASCLDGLREFMKAADTREVLLKPPFSNKMSYADQYALIKLTANSFYNARNGEDSKSLVEGEKWFKLMLEKAKNNQDKVFAASALIQGAQSVKKYDDMKSYLKYLRYDVPARSDVSLNLILLRAGDELFAAGKYLDSSTVLSLVLDRDVMLANITRFQKIITDALEKIKSNPENPLIPEYEVQLKIFAAQKEYLANMKSFKSDLMARASRNYTFTKRDYEAYWSYRQLYQTFPDHSSIEDFYFAAFAGAIKIKKNEDMFVIGNEYKKKYPQGRYSNEFDFYMAQYYMNKKEYDTFILKAREYIEAMPDEQHAGEMVFLVGKTLSEQKKFGELVKLFTDYNKRFPDAQLREGCLYWLGMASMSDGNYKDASQWFGKLIDDFPMGSYAEDASYRKGVADFGTGAFEKSRDSFESFINRYPESVLLGEVEFFLGDIYAGVGAVDAAMKHYEAVEKYTKNMAFVDNAYLQAAKLLYSTENYDREIKLMDKYLERFPKGDVSNISFNKAAALEMLGRPVSALEIYFNTILKCGGNPNDEGVDKLILDYKRLYDQSYAMTKATVEFLDEMLKDKKFFRTMVKDPGKRYQYFQANPKIDKRIYTKLKKDKDFGDALLENSAPLKALYETAKKELESFPKGGAEAALKQLFQKAVESKNLTLQYRLKMGMENIGMPVSVDKVFNDDDLKRSSVRTLVWIGKHNEKYSVDEARKAFAAALSREEVEYAIDVMFASAALEERQGGDGMGKAIQIYADIEKNFVTNERASEAALKQAAVYLKLGKRDEAFKKYETILKYPAFRGDPFAEALYNLGQISENAGKNNEALMFYDRCFLGYANCYKWTGKALLSAARILSKTDREKAKAICNEFLSNPRNKKSPEFKAVETYRDTL